MQLKLDLSFFTLTFWFPIYLNRTLNIPIKIPLKSVPQKAKRSRPGKVDQKHQPVVRVDSINVLEAKEQMQVKATIALDYAALPIKLPLELSLPQLDISLGSQRGSFVHIEVPKQTLSPQHPTLSASVVLKKAESGNLAFLVYELTRLNLSTPILVNTFDTPRECMLQRFVAGLAPRLHIPIQSLLALKPPASGYGGGDREITLEDVANPSKLVDVDLESIEGKGTGAVIKAKATISPPGHSPLHLITGLPNLAISLTRSRDGGKQPLALVNIDINNDPSVPGILNIHLTATVTDLKHLVYSLILVKDYAKGRGVDIVDPAFRSAITVDLNSPTHKTLDSFLAPLQLQIGQFDQSKAKIWFSHAPDTELNTIAKRAAMSQTLQSLKPHPVGDSSKPQKLKKINIKPAEHQITLSAEHQQDQIKVDLTARLQPANLSASPYIALHIPTLHVQLSTPEGRLAQASLGMTDIHVSTGPGAANPLANLWAPAPLIVHANIFSDPAEVGKGLTGIIEKVIRKSGPTLIIGATSKGKDAPMCALHITIPPVMLRSMKPPYPLKPSMNPVKHYLQSPNVGVHGVSEIGVVALRVGWGDCQAVCGEHEEAQQVSIDLLVNLPQIKVGVSLPDGVGGADATLNQTTIRAKVSDLKMCKFSVTQTPALYKDDKGFFVSIAPHLNVKSVLEKSDIFAGPLLRLKAHGELYLGQVVRHLALNIPTTPVHSTQPRYTPKVTLPQGYVNPIISNVSLSSDRDTFELSASVSLPKRSEKDPKVDILTIFTHYSPTVWIKQVPVTVKALFPSGPNISLRLSQLDIPIKFKEDLPANPHALYSSQLSLVIRGECKECTSQSIREAINYLIMCDGEKEQVEFEVAIGSESRQKFMVPFAGQLQDVMRLVSEMPYPPQTSSMSVLVMKIEVNR
jgi:hypothetical protein